MEVWVLTAKNEKELVVDDCRAGVIENEKFIFIIGIKKQFVLTKLLGLGVKCVNLVRLILNLMC